MTAQPASERPPRLLLRFAVYSAVALLLAGTGVLWFIRHEEQVRAERDSAARASRVAERVSDELRPADLKQPAAGRRLSELDALFSHELGDGLVYAKLWSADGRVVYSNDHSLVGSRAAPDELRHVLRGEQTSEVTQLTDGRGGDPALKALQTFVPIRLRNSGQPVGALEVDHDFAPIAESVSSAVTPIGIALGLAWLFLYAALFPILRQVTKALASRNTRLSEQAEAYRGMLEEREQVERRLSEAERNYRALVEQLPLVTYIDRLDETSSSVYMSPQVEELLGYPVTAWLSDADFFPKVLHPDDRERVLALHREAYAAGRSFSAEYRLVGNDDRVVWVRDEVMIARDSDGRPLHAQGFLIDITERKRAEEELERGHRELAALHETALLLIDELAVDKLLERILARAGELLGTSHCYVYLQESGDELEVRVGAGMFAGNVGYRLRRGEGLAGRVWETGEPLVIDDYQAWSGRRPDFDGQSFHAVIGVPLVALRETVGVLGLAHSEPGRTFGEADVALLSRFAHLASLALESARLYEAAQINEERFRNLVSNVPGVIFRCAVDKDWTMEFISDAIEEMSGYPAADFIANRVRTFASIVHPDDAEMLEREIDAALAEGRGYALEYRIVDASGAVHWVLERGRGVTGADGSISLDGAIFDVSDRRAAEGERAHLAAIVESSDDAIFSATLDGVLTSWNAGAEQMYGYTAEEVRGRPVSSLMPEERRGEMREILGLIRRGESVTHHETVRLRRDGAPIDVSVTVSPMRNSEGRIVGASGIQRDITGRKRAEAERERLLVEAEQARAELAAQNERLRELDKLKDEFIALVSHELRTPLTSIRGYVELLRDGEAGELNDEQLGFLGVVERNSHRLLTLVGDLLFLAQIEAGKLVLDVGAVDLGAVASESIESARPTAEEKGVTLGLATAPVPLLAGDRARLGQLFDNLVSNAVKFTPAGGRVDVRVRAQNGQATLEVRDSGIGIPLHEQKHLFERFFRSSNATAAAIQGTGLGLAISKAIAEAHGGVIAMASEEGAGATFRVELPIAQPAVEPDQAVAR